MTHPHRRKNVWDWMHRNDIVVFYIAFILTLILLVLVADSVREAGWAI